MIRLCILVLAVQMSFAADGQPDDKRDWRGLALLKDGSVVELIGRGRGIYLRRTGSAVHSLAPTPYAMPAEQPEPVNEQDILVRDASLPKLPAADRALLSLVRQKAARITQIDQEISAFRIGRGKEGGVRLRPAEYQRQADQKRALNTERDRLQDELKEMLPRRDVIVAARAKEMEAMTRGATVPDQVIIKDVEAIERQQAELQKQSMALAQKRQQIKTSAYLNLLLNMDLSKLEWREIDGESSVHRAERRRGWSHYNSKMDRIGAWRADYKAGLDVNFPVDLYLYSIAEMHLREKGEKLEPLEPGG